MNKITEKDIAAMFDTGHFRGHHTADVTIWLEVRPKETVLSLVQRAMRHKPSFSAHDGDQIRLKVKVRAE